MRELGVVVVACAGTGSRWRYYQGVPKHLVPVDNNEPLLHRTVRQLASRTQTPIHVVATDPGYHVLGTTFFEPAQDEWGDCYKVMSSRRLWSPDKKTLFLFGDVYFTEEAMNRILSEGSEGMAWFGRFGPNRFNGRPYGELFGVLFAPEHIPVLTQALNSVREQYFRRKIPKCDAWACYFLLEQLALSNRAARTSFVEIHDLTDDFDFPHDYDQWRKAVALHGMKPNK